MVADNAFDEALHAIVSKYLVSASVGEALDEHRELHAYGLTSLKSIDLLLDLERTFAIAIPDEYLLPTNYRTLSALRSMLLAIIEQGPSRPAP